MISYFTITIRLILSLLLGGLIGFEREKRNQPAGLRTHIILCIGSALVMLVSIFTAHTYSAKGFQSDPGRIAAQVVSGVGFLGAGAILRMGASIKGLTTAASLWTTAGIGLAVGSGFYFGSIIVTALIVITLSRLSKLEKILLIRKSDKTLNITAADKPDLLGKIENILQLHRISIKSIQFSRSMSKDLIEINTIVYTPANINASRLIKDLIAIIDITDVELQ